MPHLWGCINQSRVTRDHILYKDDVTQLNGGLVCPTVG